MRITIFLAVVAACGAHARTFSNEIVYETPRIKSGDELLSAVVNDCFSAESTMECLKVKVLTYLDSVLGLGEESSRAFEGDNIDKVIYDRVGRIIQNNEFRVTLPEFIFQNAQIVYRSDRGLDVAFPEEKQDETSEARGVLKKKLLLPVLLLLKLKMKALMPIFVALIGLKAMKALVLSKIAIVLVVGFLVLQLVKKGGMPMAMAMTPAPEPVAAVPATAYGPAAPSTAYGPASSAATPSDSYSPNWEPSASGGPYSRVWDSNSAHNVAYSAYYPGSSSSSSSSSYSPSSSSSTSTLVSSSSS